LSNPTNPGERARFSAPRKAARVLRLHRGESLELLSRGLGDTVATVTGWREGFLVGAEAPVKSQTADDRDEEIARLRAKVGELTQRPEYRHRTGPAVERTDAPPEKSPAPVDSDPGIPDI
jgi:hypothetical protein